MGAAWVLWLTAPLVVPVLVAVLMWWRGRPPRPATTTESIADHHRYLQVLGTVTHAGDRNEVKYGG